MSVLDLNVEGGEIEIINGETKPMLRVSTPLFNEDGDKLGIVIVNYLADELFNALNTSGSNTDDKIEIINEDGYYLYSNDATIEFGFMYDDLEDEVFSKYHSYDIFSNTNGVVVSDEFDDEFYTSLTLTSVELTDAANSTHSTDLNIEFGTKEFVIFSELDFSDSEAYTSIVKLYITLLITSLIVILIITRLLDEAIHLNQENIKRMKYDSMHDLLTTLPNRKNMNEHIENQLKRNKKFTILFIDFYGFKNVNDQFGHDIGDEALIQGSERINNNIRFDDVLGRIGGDEFLVLLKELEDPIVISRICEGIIESFKEIFDLSGNKATLGISIGAYICTDNTISMDEIISNSDNAMYQVKNSGKNNYIIFNNK